MKSALKYFSLNRIILAMVFLTLSLNGNSQQFTEINANLPGFKNANVEWGDYDNDSDLDILIVGRKMLDQNSGATIPASEIYRNDGNNIFTLIEADITGVYNGYAAWGDFDNDNDLDILVSGRPELGNFTTVTRVFSNEGNDSFVLSASLDSLDNSYADWGDINNDGFLDILLTGDYYTGPMDFNPKTILYQNNQAGSFFEVNTEITDLSYGSCNFTDTDNDGDLDLFISGAGFPGIVSEIYLNNNGVFTLSAQNITGSTKGVTAWADYDNDGDFDFLLAGAEGGVSASSTKLYKNVDNVFSEVTLSGDTMPNLSFPSADWGDFDNDGDMDLLLTGQIGILATRYSGVFRNDGNDTFIEITEGIFPVRTGDARWGDYDNDGDLDIIQCGTDTTDTFGEYVTKIYRNNTVQQNNTPTPPGDFSAELFNGGILFSWTAGMDTETPEAALSYNIRIGTSTGTSNVVAPMTVESSGHRSINKTGNAGMNRFYFLSGPDTEVYYWSIQCIDGAYAGSQFSEEQTIDLTSVGLQDRDVLEIELEIFPNPASEQVKLRFVNKTAATATIRLFDNSGKQVFYKSPGFLTKGDQDFSIPIEALSPGAYNYLLTIGNKSASGKLIVE